MPYTQAMPVWPISSPATAGPTTAPTWNRTCRNDRAATRLSFPTRNGTTELRAGLENPASPAASALMT